MEQRPFSSRAFRLFFVGNLVSNSGTWLHNVAQGVLVLELTGRSTMVGVAQAATFVPVLVLALHGGRLADRLDRRRLLVVAQVVAALATAALAVLAGTGGATFVAVVVVALVLGVQFAIAVPATMALIPSLVPPPALAPAMGLTSITYNLARTAGPVLATAAIASLGFGLAFAVNAVSFLVLAAALAAIPSLGEGRTAEGTSIAEGVRYAWRDRRIRAVLGVVAAVAIATDPIYTLAPALAASAFGRDPVEAGVLVSAFGTGAIAAALAFVRFLRRPAAERRAVGGASVWVLAIGVVGMALAPSFGIGLGFLVVAGAGYLLANTTWTTELQEEGPEGLRGRVMALWTLCFVGTRPVASVVDGILADVVGPRAATLAMLAPLTLAALVLLPALVRPRLKT